MNSAVHTVDCLAPVDVEQLRLFLAGLALLAGLVHTCQDRSLLVVPHLK